jgi:hypothetical protein
LFTTIKKVYKIHQSSEQKVVDTTAHSTEAIFNALVEAEKDALLQEGKAYNDPVRRHRNVLPKWPLENSKELTELKEY